MTTGTRVVLGFVLFALAVFAVLEFYGRGSLDRREPDSPAAAAHRIVQADNTVVGLIGGITAFEPLAIEVVAADSAVLRVEASVLGARDSGRLAAEVRFEGGRWVVRRARFTLSDGTTIPVAGSAGR